MSEHPPAMQRGIRGFGARLLAAMPVSFACAFTFALFGILDIYLHNTTSFPFHLDDILLPTLLETLGCFAVLALALSLLRGRLFDWGLSLALSLLVAGYVQGNFLNLPLGQLTGEPIPWAEHAHHGTRNLLVWAAMLIVSCALLQFWPRVRRFLCWFIPVLLVGMQLAGLVRPLRAGVPKAYGYLYTDGMFELSARENILVLVLDRLDSVYVDTIRAEEPDFFDALDGFTYFRNNISTDNRTFPAVATLLTGRTHAFDRAGEDYFTLAYGESDFLPLLRQHNYTTKLYMSYGYTYSSMHQLANLADNACDGAYDVQIRPVMERMNKLSAFRYMPHAFKEAFWLSTSEFEHTVSVSEGKQPYVTDDYALYQEMLQQGLSVQDARSNFIYLHLHGSHGPLNLNEHVERVTDQETSYEQQAMGCLRIVFEYLERMKQLGLYEDATILIMGDHGISTDRYPLDYAIRTALFVKPAGSAGTPLVMSNAPVSHSDFQATILRAAGIENDAFGDATYFDIAEDAPRTRRIVYRSDDPDMPGRRLLESYDVTGDAEDFANWHKVYEYEVPFPYM